MNKGGCQRAKDGSPLMWRNDLPTNVKPFSEESVLKPVGDMARIVAATSPADLLLFLIALNKQKTKQTP